MYLHAHTLTCRVQQNREVQLQDRYVSTSIGTTTKRVNYLNLTPRARSNCPSKPHVGSQLDGTRATTLRDA